MQNVVTTGIEINPEFAKAMDFMENGKHHVFLTGKAGTGKSTLLSYFCENTGLNHVILAPTGVAALNVGGQTIHSFFGFRPNITKDQIKRSDWHVDFLRNLDVIIIDEVSMLRADLLDYIDEFLRINRNPAETFGGIKMIFIGDLFQLPPVVTGNEEQIFKDYYDSPYFFSAHCLAGVTVRYIELTKIYRQNDRRFIDILNNVRNNNITYRDISELNRRVDRGFEPSEDEFYIWLTPFNKTVMEINSYHLSRLEGEAHRFTADIRGDFEEKYYPLEDPLILKIGAQVMLLNNDIEGRWVNGSMGKITKIEDDLDYIEVQLNDGDKVRVGKNRWDIYRYEYSKAERHIKAVEIGSFTQYPIRPAWAITIHKSQGKTFDRAIIDMGRGAFSTGQTYVALSRCRSLEGIILKTPINQWGVWSDKRVMEFIENIRG
ncbi:MAG: AAA family ATPase [Brevinematales bacterium]|nr:AAA family ATPase [Brevinematales bacterium]